ncbi:RagB/SusD family nutrient uptake outer membrane protein [Flavivirga rizhaonensis]|uniref:RagB/SusD family nutrient uptake outer membrane protein n=1 Tax=Flavivirga rizhaonensis TaxID=2559571 RepID=A0A4S1DUN8_9FLAO|nr:RagB/SusD family nutrient uptake outer membrane protein [Flavivirga rizhaonensis]TGV01811.1 RagB/SusD family nutrient uptake outer membrane protein [Flavivirga rizhaonensis]
MKNIKFYIMSLGLFLALSCDDNLDLAPLSQLSSSNFYQTEADFEQAIIGVYSGLRNEFNNIYVFGDIRSDNTVPVISGSVTTLQDFDNFTIDPSNSIISSQWRNAYINLSRANIILDKIDGVDIDESVKNRIKGEALFARGVVYLNLVRIYGNVPLVLTEISALEALEFPQSSPDAVYAQVVADLSAATGLLPVSYGGSDIGRATSIAANAVLGRAQLTNGNYAAAETALRAVTAMESGGTVSLLPDFADVFDTSNEYNAEIIFATRFANDGINGNGFNYGFANALEPNNKATGTTLFDAYEVGDLRRDLTLNTTAAPGEILTYKYGPPGDNGHGESDWPVIRYSDVLLMLSEALNEQGYTANGEAFTLLNRIRNRAGLADLTSATITNQADFRLAMEQERRAELASEGHRWFDLVRTGRYEALLGSMGAKSTSNLFPIPLGEIVKINDPSILTQNPGY